MDLFRNILESLSFGTDGNLIFYQFILKNVFFKGTVKIESDASSGGQEKLKHVIPFASA
jgi:hypothetical protein